MIITGQMHSVVVPKGRTSWGLLILMLRSAYLITLSIRPVQSTGLLDFTEFLCFLVSLFLGFFVSLFLYQCMVWGTTNIRIEGMNCDFWSGLRNEMRFLGQIAGMNCDFGLDWRDELQFWSRLGNELRFLVRIEEWIGMQCMFVVTQD